MTDMSSYELDENSFIGLLGKLIGESKHLQNNPPGTMGWLKGSLDPAPGYEEDHCPSCPAVG
jgi:hypothetical protein